MSSADQPSLVADTAAAARTCGVALKEWAAVVEALKSGQQSLLFRKGGIRESGFLVLEQTCFFLFPTYEHQNHDDLKTEAHRWLSDADQGGESITFTCYAEVSDVYRAREYRLLKRLHDLHVYTPVFLQKRLAYRPSLPLYVMLLRVYVIEPQTIPLCPDYAGCRSWVSLEKSYPLCNPRPAISDQAFAQVKRRLDLLLPAEKLP